MKREIEDLRAWMSAESVDAMVIPSEDPHFGEYTPERFRTREFLSGFTGSAGTLAVTAHEAALWTDSRYFDQAASQLEGSGIVLMKQGVQGVPSVCGWLSSLLQRDSVIALDGSLFSEADVKAYESVAAVRLVEDPFDAILPSRPGLEFRRIELMPAETAGETPSSKRKRLWNGLASSGIRYDGGRMFYFTQLCDECAWLVNLRGSDVEFNPVFLSYCLVGKECTVLFADRESISEEVMSCLEAEGVIVEPYGSVAEYVRKNLASSAVVIDRSKVSVSWMKIFEEAGVRVFDDPLKQGSVAMMKAVKNAAEMDGFRLANRIDGAAWVRFLKYVDENASSGLTEYDLVRKIMEFRRSGSVHYRGESFSPIVAYGASASFPHYEPSPESSATLGSGNFLLADTGGQYSFGTTDVTRTIPLGKIDDEARLDYTMVLKGMIDLSMAVFRHGYTGAQLDFLARGPVSSLGKLYYHGTGHGIGHYLNVHEGPQSIRMEQNPTPVLPGMVTSNEPAVYVTGKYGIRIENTILCVRHCENEFGIFNSFETISLVPIECGFISDLIDVHFSQMEKDWLHSYNRKVLSELSEYLSEEEKKWYVSKYL